MSWYSSNICSCLIAILCVCVRALACLFVCVPHVCMCMCAFSARLSKPICSCLQLILRPSIPSIFFCSSESSGFATGYSRFRRQAVGFGQEDGAGMTRAERTQNMAHGSDNLFGQFLWETTYIFCAIGFPQRLKPCAQWNVRCTERISETSRIISPERTNNLEIEAIALEQFLEVLWSLSICIHIYCIHIFIYLHNTYM